MAFIWSSSPVKSSFMSWLWIIGVAVLPQYGPHPVVMGYFAPCPIFFFFPHCFYSFHSEAFVTVAGPKKKKKIILSVLCLKPCLIMWPWESVLPCTRIPSSWVRHDPPAPAPHRWTFHWGKASQIKSNRRWCFHPLPVPPRLSPLFPLSLSFSFFSFNFFFYSLFPFFSCFLQHAPPVIGTQCREVRLDSLHFVQWFPL